MEDKNVRPHEVLTVDQLIEGAPLPFDVFIQNLGLHIPLFNKGTVYDATARAILRERSVQSVYVPAGAAAELERYLAKGAERPKAPDPAVYRQYTVDKSAHFFIERSLLIPGTDVAFSLLLLNDYRLTPLLHADESHPARIEPALLATPGDIVIHPDDIPRYRAYIDQLLKGDMPDTLGRESVKRAVIKENSKMVLRGLLAEPRSGARIKESVGAVHGMVDAILENRDAAGDLLSIRTYDYYTYTHSVNVAVLSVGLGMGMGLKRPDLEKLGIGAMLHDLGKSAIPIDLLNKPGRLDDDEFKTIKTHVVKGEALLRGHKEIPAEALSAVSEHHERLSGKGYPYNKTGAELTMFGRITSIVDCYDALTSNRCYQAARTPYFALSILTREAGDYDGDVLKEFIKMLGLVKT